MQKYFGNRIADLLPRINSEIFIPSIQRPYVWEPSQIVRLFDSLMRGYPINTFLFWELEPEHFGDWDIYRFVRDFRQGDTHNDPADLTAGAPLTLVLDGQQRLTSLLIGLTGSYHVRNGKRGKGAGYVQQILFLNLLEAPHGSGDEEDEAPVTDLHYGFKFVNADKLPKNTPDAVWFPVTKIMVVTDRDQLAASIDELCMLHEELTDAQRDVLSVNLRRLFEVVHVEESLAFYLEKEQSYDKVLDIFIRANDGGTKLSKADLLMSMVTLRWDQFNARDETEELTKHLRNTLQQEKAFDRDYLLRSGLFFNNLDFAFQLRNFTPRNIAVIEARWEELKHALRMTAALFSRYGIVGSALTGTNAVMLVALYVFKVNGTKPINEWTIDADNAERIRRWIISVLFQSVLSGAANVTMELYRRIVSESLLSTDRFPAQLLAVRMTTRGRGMTFTEEVVGRFVSQDASGRLGKMSLSLLYDEVDWNAAEYRAVPIMPSHRLLDERLRVQGVPDAKIPQLQSWSGRLANACLFDEEEAKQYYAVDYEDWVATRTPEFLAKHHLPTDLSLYDEFNFLGWIAARKQIIAARLQGIYHIEEVVVADALKAAMPAEDDDLSLAEQAA